MKNIFTKQYSTLQYLFKWLAICGVIGACIGTASAGFLQSLTWATKYREAHIWLIALLPIAGFAVGLLYHYYGKSVTAGNNLLIDTIHQPAEVVPFRMAPFVYVGTIITHFFGGSAGREGTALQMSGAIADQFAKPFGLDADERRVLMIAAIAAGFGSVFGTPLAGAIFGLEVFLIGKIRYNAIFPVFAASIIADLVTKGWGTPHTSYVIDFVPEMSVSYLGYAVLAGIFFGICALLFSHSLKRLSDLFKSQISYPPLRPLFGGALVALAVLALGTTKYIGLGIPTIVESFQHQLPAYDFALKFIFTVVTLAAGFKGGEVTPLFFIGAALGNALSYFVPLPTALLAGMGFVAVFAGATNTPLACTLMALELFGSGCGVFVGVACVVSYLFSGHSSIYGQQKIGKSKHVALEKEEGRRISDL